MKLIVEKHLGLMQFSIILHEYGVWNMGHDINLDFFVGIFPITGPNHNTHILIPNYLEITFLLNWMDPIVSARHLFYQIALMMQSCIAGSNAAAICALCIDSNIIIIKYKYKCKWVCVLYNVQQLIIIVIIFWKNL